MLSSLAKATLFIAPEGPAENSPALPRRVSVGESGPPRGTLETLAPNLNIINKKGSPVREAPSSVALGEKLGPF